MIEYRVDFDMQEMARGYAKRLGAHLDEAVLDELEPTLNEMGWFKRKPCHDVGDPSDFCCSECGVRMFTESNDTYTMIAADERTIIKHPNFCPNCGRKVVGA